MFKFHYDKKINQCRFFRFEFKKSKFNAMYFKRNVLQYAEEKTYGLQ